MDSFKRASESKAIDLIKKGQRPEKLVKKQSSGQPAPLDKKKSSGGGKKKQHRKEDNSMEEAKSQAREMICPFREQEIVERLNEASKSGELVPAVDEMIVDTLSEYLTEAVSKQFWEILSEVD